MSCYGSLIINGRRFLQDSRASFWSNNDLGILIDEGAKLLQNELKLLYNRTSLAVVKNQAVYALASNVLVPQDMEYYQAGGRWKVKAENLNTLRNNFIPIYGTVPRLYALMEDRLSFQLQPRPDTAADTTTLKGSHSATVTTLTVASTSSFPVEGRLIIESEVVFYTGTTSTTFTGVTRGAEGTTAASHADAITVTERDLMIWGVRRYRDREMRTYYSTGTVTATLNSTTVTGAGGTAWTTSPILANDQFGITTDTTGIDPVHWYNIASVDTDTQLTLSETFKEATASTSSYIVSSPNPFPNNYDGFFRSYILANALDKEGDLKGAREQWQKIERMLDDARIGRHEPDRLLYPRGRHDWERLRGTRMPASGGATYLP